MDSDELCHFFKTIGAGGKKIGGVHDNFGVGAKIASLPWNPEGVVVVSYKDGKASMIWIVLDADSGEYDLVEFETAKGMNVVADPGDVDDGTGVDWGKIKPQWVGPHGTIIVLLGSKESPDTVLGNPHTNEGDSKGLSGYLNTRFWDLKDIEVKVVELPSTKKTQWPQSVEDKDDARRAKIRNIFGAKYYLTDIVAEKAKLKAAGSIVLDSDRVTAEWYLWEGERPDIHSYSKRGGYIAMRYKDELFELTSHKAQFRWFGIIESKVQQNLTIILEPQHYGEGSGRWGVHPDQSRNRLIFTGNGEKGGPMPLADWGREFSEKIPDPIMEAIRDARGGDLGSIEDEEYRRRLQDRFGNRWTMKALVKTSKQALDSQKISLDDIDVLAKGGNLTGASSLKPKVSKPRRVMRALPAGAEEGVLREVPVDIPHYRYAKKEDFDKPFHLASWVPNDPKGPTVLLNSDAPVLLEMIKYHQEQYLDIYAEEIAEAVRKVFGELAVAKIAHSQKLARDVAEQDLNESYRSEAALTTGLMGLVAEDVLIAQRLRKYGAKKEGEDPK
jgi:hypothetical protein